MDHELNPLAGGHYLPWFITAPGQSDSLLIAMGIFLIVVVIAIGNIYFQLHALPEKWAHHTSPVQVQIVAVLAILALFTHNHVFWIAALLLALVQFPDFSSPIYSMADSLSRLAGRLGTRDENAEATGQPPADETVQAETVLVTSAADEVTVIKPAPEHRRDERTAGGPTDA